MRIHHDERGQTILLVALSLPIILGFVGMATDVGSLFMDKRQMQTAADAGALAGALNYNAGYTVWKAAAQTASGVNGFTDGSRGVTVSVPQKPAWPSSNYYNKTGYVEVTVSKAEPTIFLALFGHSSVTVAARAVATNQAPGNGCIYGLGTSGTDFSANGSVSVSANDCGMVLDSTSTAGKKSGAALVQGGNATISMGSIAVAGGDSLNKSANVTPTPVLGVVPSSDPLSYLPQYSCTSGGGCSCTSNCTNDPVTPPASCVNAVLGKGPLQPGCYNGFNIGNGSLTLNSGVYFLTGPINMNGNATFTGTGITLIMTGTASIPSMQGTETMDISAPDKNGAFPGLLYYQQASDTSPIQMGGNASSTIEGVFYAPTAQMTLQGNPGGNIYTDFVVSSLILGGNATFNSYAALPGGAGGLTSIALVE